MSKTLPFREQLRRAVERSDLTQAEISRRTGIAESILSRFRHRRAAVSMDSIDKLCECLGLRLVADKRRAKRKGR